MIFGKKKTPQLDPNRIPQHIGFILDGNGRWAKRRGLPRSAGHNAGARNIKHIAKYCYRLGVKSITLYAFSTENWNRPKEEVEALMELLYTYLVNFQEELDGDDAKIKVIGNRSRLSEKIRQQMQVVEDSTKENTGLVINIAINYGGRAEIVHAVNEAIQQNQPVTEETISQHLYTDYSDIDLIIRPSGEQRLSNFLLWQAAYSEFYYCNVLWPDFSEKHLLAAVLAYQDRDRRFGGV